MTDLHPNLASSHDSRTFTHADNQPIHGYSNQLESDKVSIELSEYTKSLIKSWKDGAPKPSLSPTKISVSQTVSFFAFLYEKVRNAVEFREDHLIRRAAIERIIKRRMFLNENGRDIAEVLIKELLWSRYYENNTIGEEKNKEVQTVIDKYFFLRNEIAAGRSGKEKEAIGSFIVEVMSCEIEELLSPSTRREAFTNYAYQLIRNRIDYFSENKFERDILVYIAVERNLANSDNALIRHHLLKLMLPEISNITWRSGDKVLPRLFDIYKDIEFHLNHALNDKIRRIIKKQIPPFLILQDVFKQNINTIESILTDEVRLKQKVDEACRKRYQETKERLKRTGVRSFIYIVLTKVVFAFVLEIPYDLYIVKSISYIPIIVNVVFPPVLMSAIILSVTVPGDENTRRIFSSIKGIISENPESEEVKSTAIKIGKYTKKQGLIFTALFSGIYLFTYLLSFGSIIYALSVLNFNPVSQAIFIFFVTLVTFFAYRVINITQEYLVIDKEGPFSPITDFYFLPIMRVGQMLSDEVLAKFNVLIFVFDFIIEMPLKAIVEVVDEWFHFVRLKKEEIV